MNQSKIGLAYEETDRDLFKLYKLRSRRTIYQIAKEIKTRASIYGIFRINDKNERTDIKVKDMTNKV